MSGYQNLSVGNVQTRSVSGLSAGAVYYYRVRAQNGSGTSGNSETIAATTVGWRISGRVTNYYTGAGVDGIVVSFANNGGLPATTAGGGYYTGTVAYVWGGNITPSLGSGGFVPVAKWLGGLTGDATGQDFAWVPPDPQISGRITNRVTGAGVAHATVRFSGGAGTAATDAGGNYARTVPHGWSGTASATLDAAYGTGSFAPAERSYADVADSQTAQDFEFQPDDPEISGRVLNEDTGGGEDGVVVTLSNGGGAATTADGGYYRRTVPYGWTGTATPSHSTPYGSGTFAPAARGYTNVCLDRGAQDYGWDAPAVPGTKYVSLTGLNQHPYTNWEMAARNIQTAVNAALPGEEIVVADGTYSVAGLTTIGKPVTVRSLNGPGATTVRRTSGNTGIFLLTTNAVLDGFTVRDGSIPTYGAAQGTAGGVGAEKARWCATASSGTTTGEGAACGRAEPEERRTAIQCLIVSNRAGGNSIGDSFNAGGVKLDGGSRLINCVVAGNRKVGGHEGSDGIYAGAGAPSNSGTNWLDNTIVWDNALGRSPADAGTLVARHSRTPETAWLTTEAGTAAEPAFVDAGAGDYRLQESSPHQRRGERLQPAVHRPGGGAADLGGHHRPGRV